MIARQKILNARLIKAREEAEERHTIEREKEMIILQEVGLRQNSMSPERALGSLGDVAAEDADMLETKTLCIMARKMSQEKEIERINEIEGLNKAIEKTKSFSTLSELNKAIARTETLAQPSQFSTSRERRPIREMFKDLHSKKSAAFRSCPDLFRGQYLHTVPGVQTNDSDESTPECSPAKMQRTKQRANSQGDIKQEGGLPKDGPIEEATEADKEMPSETNSGCRSQSSNSAESGSASSKDRSWISSGAITWSFPDQIIGSGVGEEEGWVMSKDVPQQERSNSEPIVTLSAAGMTGQNESAAPLSAAQMEEGWLLAQSHPTREGLDHSRQRQGAGASSQAQKPPAQATSSTASNDDAFEQDSQDSLEISDAESDIFASGAEDSSDDGERVMRASRGPGGEAGSLQGVRHNMQRRFVWN